MHTNITTANKPQPLGYQLIQPIQKARTCPLHTGGINPIGIQAKRQLTAVKSAQINGIKQRLEVGNNIDDLFDLFVQNAPLRSLIPQQLLVNTESVSLYTTHNHSDQVNDEIPLLYLSNNHQLAHANNQTTPHIISLTVSSKKLAMQQYINGQSFPFSAILTPQSALNNESFDNTNASTQSSSLKYLGTFTGIAIGLTLAVLFKHNFKQNNYALTIIYLCALGGFVGHGIASKTTELVSAAQQNTQQYWIHQLYRCMNAICQKSSSDASAILNTFETSQLHNNQLSTRLGINDPSTSMILRAQYFGLKGTLAIHHHQYEDSLYYFEKAYHCHQNVPQFINYITLLMINGLIDRADNEFNGFNHNQELFLYYQSLKAKIIK